MVGEDRPVRTRKPVITYEIEHLSKLDPPAVSNKNRRSSLRTKKAINNGALRESSSYSEGEDEHLYPDDESPKLRGDHLSGRATRVKDDPDFELDTPPDHHDDAQHVDMTDDAEIPANDDEGDEDDDDADEEVETQNVSKAPISIRAKREVQPINEDDEDDEDDDFIQDVNPSTPNDDDSPAIRTGRRDQSTKHPVLPNHKTVVRSQEKRKRRPIELDDDEDEDEDGNMEDYEDDNDVDFINEDELELGGNVRRSQRRDRAAKSNGVPDVSRDDEYNLNSDTIERNENDNDGDSAQQLKSLPLKLPMRHPSSNKDERGGVRTKSGRISKPVLPGTPDHHAIKRKDRDSPIEQRKPSREERYRLRQNRVSGGFENSNGNYAPVYRSSKRRKTGSSHPAEDYNEGDVEDDGEDFMIERRMPSRRRSEGRRRNDRATHSALRRSARRQQRSTDSVGLSGADGGRRNRYQTRQLSANGAGKIGSRNDNSGLPKDSDDDGKEDHDFEASGGDESDDPSDEGIEEHEDSGNENDSPGGSDHVETEGGRILRSGKNGMTTRNLRKRVPLRSVRSTRRKGSSTQENRGGFDNEIRKSFRTRNGSVRPSDFYREDGGDGEANSDQSLTSDGENVRRPRRRRQSATRAADAIASNVDRVDFLSNPMAVAEDGKGASRAKRPDRFGRHRNRRQPSSFDPYVSDDDNQQAQAPIEPIEVDVNLSWNDIGGLDHHVRALKEMVFLPLLYPEVFEKFNMEAPKGVLFYGPPGTGKTLCARALAASCGAVEEVDETAEAGDKNNIPRNSASMSEAPASDPAIVPKTLPVQDPNGVNPAEASAKIAISRPGLKESQATTEDVEIARNDQANGEVVPGNETNGNITPDAGLANRTASVAVDTNATSGSGDKAEGVKKANTKAVKKKPRVAFFMRNGADCLSKWVGEAERQLRMTFEAAKRHQPAIIFFDEIDGLAPVRSSKQDQIHSSIVSTLLGLMDGLDARGKIVVIGATNRVDAIDPALRRPGRFDRELIFTLPNMTARRKILGIHTCKWAPSPKQHVLDAVAKMTVGYCGADLKALCSESAIRALRRRYPQVYQSSHKLLIDVDQVRVGSKDFLTAMSNIVPASHRSAKSFARPLPQRLLPVLGDSFKDCLEKLKEIFPQGLPVSVMSSASSPISNRTCGVGGGKDNHMFSTSSNNDSSRGNNGIIDEGAPGQDLDDYLSSSEDEINLDDETNGGTLDVTAMQTRISNAGRMRPSGMSSMRVHQSLRPRLLIYGSPGLGQGQIGPALLHLCEGCPVHPIDITSLHSDLSARSPEESLMSAFREAARSVPSIVYLPHLQLWWGSASQTLRTSLIIALKDIPADLPLLVLATAEEQLSTLPEEAVELFGNTFQLRSPSVEGRREMFAPVVAAAKARPRISEAAARKRKRQRVTEVLPRAPPPPVKPPTVEQVAQTVQNEERYIRMQRMEMREFLELLLRDRKYKPFWTPVDPNLAPDYYDIIKIPMDLQKIAGNIDQGLYPTVLSMVRDFDIMVQNAIQYNPPSTEVGSLILRRAHGLIDVVYAWMDNLNQTMVEMCNKIVMDRIGRKNRENNDNGAPAAPGSGSSNDTAEGKTAAQVEVGSIAVEGENKTMSEKDVVMVDGNNGGDNNSSCADKDAAADVVAVGPNLVVDEVQSQPRDGAVGGSSGRNKGGKRVDVMDLDVIAPARNEKEVCGAPAVVVAVRSEDDEMDGNEQDNFLPAQPSQMAELESLLVEVTGSMSVDALEGLMVRCENVLFQFRYNMNRIAAVRELSTTVCIARDDPSLVGNLVD